MKRRNHLIIPLLLLLCLPACIGGCRRSEEPKIRIGVSQCSDDDWRDKLNQEIHREMLFHDDATVEILTACDDSEKQISDIRHFIDEKVDVILASPNQAEALTPVLKEAYESGIPVVIFDRGVTGGSYTSFIEFDNEGIGRSAADYASGRLREGAKVIEIAGLDGSTPARGRHEGFVAELERLRPDVVVAASRSAGWKEAAAERAVDSLLRVHPDVALIYAHNDLMAIGASKALSKAGLRDKVLVLGTDAAPNVGMQAVADSVIDATFIYPTDGHRLVQTAMQIAHGGKVAKHIVSPALPPVDRRNAEILRAQNQLLRDETNKILLLKQKNDEIASQSRTQASWLNMVAGALLLLAMAASGLLWAYLQRARYEKLLKEKNAQLALERDKQAELYNQLDDATRSKLTFFTNVSHDLRTPLTLISEPVEQLTSRGNLTPSDRVLAQLALKNTRILRRLIDQILDFRSYDSGNASLVLSEVEICSVVADWAESFRTVADKRHISLSVKCEEDGGSTLALDVEKMERVVFNLVSNAFKYSPDGAAIEIGCRLTQDQFTLSVSDTGYGIKKEDIDRIFDRFFTVGKLCASGSGIGLSVAKAFIELHGGTISAESRVGKGSVFTVSIPVRHVASVAEPVKSQLSAKAVETELSDLDDPGCVADNGKPLVLIVDDNADLLLMMQQLLKEDYNVITAADGIRGVRLAAKYVPDLVVCDIMMPGIDGLEVCRKLKEEASTSHVPVLMLTASALDCRRIESYRCGADGFLAKPFNTGVLLSRIRNLLENRRRIKDIYDVSAAAPADAPSRPIPDISDRKSLESDFYRKFITIIKEEYSDSELDTEAIAGRLGIGAAQLTRKIKALTALSPVEILKNYRLKLARTLLLSSERTVSEIAYEVGFSSPPYLSKCFRDAYGISPTEFRKQ